MNEIYTVSCDAHHYPDSHSPFTKEELDNLHEILQTRLGETYEELEDFVQTRLGETYDL